MNSEEKVLFSWSGGKDSALSLYEIQKRGELEVESLITTVTADYDRVSMHGLRRELLHTQAESLGLSIEEVLISKEASNKEYEQNFESALRKYRDSGTTKIVFGDIYLQDIRDYREALMKRIGMECLFPIWGMDSSALAERFIDNGFKAVVICVDTEQLDAEYAGREYDASFLSDLPSDVDPCGENGEFHTFVYDGPTFNKPIDHRLGEIILRDERFCYCDVLPADK